MRRKRGVHLINHLGLDPAIRPRGGTTRPAKRMGQPIGLIGHSIGHGLLPGADLSVTQAGQG
jgi:hypothetical protein